MYSLRGGLTTYLKAKETAKDFLKYIRNKKANENIIRPGDF